MKTLEHAATKNTGPLKVTSHTAHATPNTQKNCAHGLTDSHGRAVTPTVVIVTPIVADDANAISPLSAVSVISYDATNVRVKSAAGSQAFLLQVG